MSRFSNNEWPWSLDGEPDWYALHGASGGYISDACVEGTEEEWLAVAEALEAGDTIGFKRLRALRVKGGYEFYSPRNTRGRVAVLPIDKAPILAVHIRTVIASHSSDATGREE